MPMMPGCDLCGGDLVLTSNDFKFVVFVCSKCGKPFVYRRVVK